MKGDGPGFTMVFPDFEKYFERLRGLAGEPRDGRGRVLPRFESGWVGAFMRGHERRIKWWREENERARRERRGGEVEVEVEVERARL